MKSTSKTPGIAQIKERSQELKSTSPSNYHVNHISTDFLTPALTSSKFLYTNILLLPLEPLLKPRQGQAQPSPCPQPYLIHAPHLPCIFSPTPTQLPSYFSVLVLARVRSVQALLPDQNCRGHTTHSIRAA